MFNSQRNSDFSLEYKSVALVFVCQCGYEYARGSPLEYNVTNDNVSVEEVDTPIDYLEMAQAKEWILFLQNSLTDLNRRP